MYITFLHYLVMLWQLFGIRLPSWFRALRRLFTMYDDGTNYAVCKNKQINFTYHFEHSMLTFTSILPSDLPFD
jgi:hypothetical protein